MRIAREIIETLKMELRFIKYKNTQLEVTSLQKEVQLSLEARLGGFSFNLPSIHDVAFSKSSLNVLSIIQNYTSTFNISSIEKIDTNIKDVKFQDITNYRDVSLEGITKIREVCGYFQNQEQRIDIKNGLSAIKDSKIRFEKPIIQSTKLKSVEFIPKRIIVKSNLFGSISCSYYVPQDYVERDKLLGILNVLRNKYDISKIKFYAYYKDIPLEISKVVKIASSKRLYIQFDTERLENRALRKNVNLRNLIVFRYDDKFLYYPI